MVNLDKVAQYDFVVVIDGSGSMAVKDVKDGWFSKISRWDSIEKTAVSFSQDLEKIDTDGIGLVVFSDGAIHSYSNASSQKVAEAFKVHSPDGGTPLAEALTAAIDLLKPSTKKKFIMVFTDGVPNNKDRVRKVIIDQANSQASDDEMTILFVQVGHDPDAAKYLCELDDNLKEAKFDIVDTKSVSEANKFTSTLELVVHAIGD